MAGSLQKPLFSWGNTHEFDAQERVGVLLWTELERRAAAGILSRIADKWQQDGIETPLDLDVERQNQLLNMATRLMGLSDFVLDDTVGVSPDGSFHLNTLIDINNPSHYTIQLLVPTPPPDNDVVIDPSKFLVKTPNVDGDNGMEIDGNHFALSINNRGLQAAIGINQLSDHPAIDMVAASAGGTTPPLTLGVAADHNSGYLRLVGGYGTWDAINNERAYVAPDNGALPAANSSRVGCIMVLNGLGYICEEIGGSFLWQPITGAPGATGAPGSPGATGAPGANATCADCAIPIASVLPITGHDRLCDLSVAIVLSFQDTIKAARDVLAVAGGFASMLSAITPLLTAMELGPLAAIPALANGLLSLSIAALDAAFNNAVWSAVQCDLYCNGTSNPAKFTDTNISALKSAVVADAAIGIVAQSILNLIIDTVGSRGLSNALSLYNTATGDCSSCNCPLPGYDWQIALDFKQHAYHANVSSKNGNAPYGWVAGKGLSSGYSGWIVAATLSTEQTSGTTTIGYGAITAYHAVSGAGGQVYIATEGHYLLQTSATPWDNLGGTFVSTGPTVPLYPQGVGVGIGASSFDAPGNTNECWIEKLVLAGYGVPPVFTP